MVAETAILVTIAASLASGLLNDISKKVVDVLSTSGLFGDLGPKLRLVEMELAKLDVVVCQAQSIDPIKCENNDLILLWLRSIKDAACFADNLIDEITSDKIRKQVHTKRSNSRRVIVPQLFSVFHLRIARKVNKFISMTDKIYKEAANTLKLAEIMAISPRYQPPKTLSGDLRELRENPDTSLVFGRQRDEELIVSELCSPNSNRDLPIVAIVGKSGVGKTTLAKMVYENKTVADHFDKRTWIFVSDHFNLKRFLEEMHQSIIGNRGNLSNMAAMEEKLQQRLRMRKKGYLVVLDDVWNIEENLWKTVESSLLRVTSFTRSKVLVTTQSLDIASKMRASLSHELKDLGNADAWMLFEKTAFANKTQEQVLDLEDIGRRILNKCKGLPLGIRTLGTFLGSLSKRGEWESVEESEIWSLSAAKSSIMPWLLLSFYHLPNAAIKQCFVHCSIIIEKGTSIRQVKLVQAWMAQGYIQSTGKSSMSMEEIGETYVRALVANGLLQMDARSDCCYVWMHDLIHDLALFISNNTCLSLSIRDVDDLWNASEIERLRICGDDTLKSRFSLPEGKKLSKLRTLICIQAALSTDFVARARFLRDLRIIRCGLQEVPSSIGKLKHLRYLSLAKNPFRYLPKSIGALCYLQTIDLEECYQLHELPGDITMLVNLRHIYIPWYVKRPKGMGRLTSLRTMPRITLKEKEEWKVRELKSLPLLSGEIVIAGLEHISCKKDVVEASLKTKPGITNLCLEWTNERDETYTVLNDEAIMDGLQPHLNMEVISVCRFGGKRISSWILDMNNLKTVALVSCNRCEQLPTLGQLHSLEEIKIRNMTSLEVIGAGFYHKDDESVSAHNGISRRVLFPRLKTLHLAEMPKLRDWDEPQVSTYMVFPCLEKLEVHDCPSLVSAPTCFQSLLSLSISAIIRGEPLLKILSNSSNLIALDIVAVEHLTSLSRPLLKCTSLKTLKISHCKELRELCPALHCVGSLENLEVMSCDSLTSFLHIHGLLSLHVLRIIGCNSLSTLHGLESCVSIETLALQRNTNLCWIPDLTNLSRLTSLKVTHFSWQMSICRCLSHLFSLRYLEIGAFSEELDELYGARHLPKGLKELTLYGWPKVNSLPSELQFLHQLEFLGIVGFEGVETLEEWMGNLSSLHELHIDKCTSLKYLPSLEAMRRLTKLRKLEIFDCPFLSERCNKFGGEEWNKILHLSSIRIQFREQLDASVPTATPGGHMLCKEN